MAFKPDCEITVTLLGHRITFPMRRMGENTFESDTGHTYVTRNGALYLTDQEATNMGSLVIPAGDCWMGNSPSVSEI